MKTTILKIDKNRPDMDKLAKAAAALRAGGVVVIPTDTVYGLAACAFETKAQKSRMSRTLFLFEQVFRDDSVRGPRDEKA